MKKDFITPRVHFLKVKTKSLLASSGVSGTHGITYGGTDNNGTLDPSAKDMGGFSTHSNIWED